MNDIKLNQPAAHANNEVMLWKYSCRPNYPVCEAYLLFITHRDTTVEEATALAMNLAFQRGFTNPDTGAKLERYGLLNVEGTNYGRDNCVLSYANGEY